MSRLSWPRMVANEEESLVERALRAGVPYVGLVASRKRGAAVVEELRSRGALEEQELARIRHPGGTRHRRAHRGGDRALDPCGGRGQRGTRCETVPAVAVTAVDPVCGMEVTAASPSPHSERDGRTVWFCGEGCKRAFEADVPSS